MTTMDKSAELTQEPSVVSNPLAVGGTLLGSWMIPGMGFVLHGRHARGLTLFVLLNLTFAIGIIMHGGVIWPVWKWSDDGFNLVNNLTFIIQLGAGIPALLSLIASQSGGQGPLGFLAANPESYLYDLSSFYLMVSGAMNYFVVCNTYDRLFTTQSEKRGDQSNAAKKD